MYLAGRRIWPRYAVPAVLVLGIGVAGLQGQLHVADVSLQWAEPVFIAPTFSWAALIGVAIPLFAVTMASQNVPGVAVMRAAGYDTPVSPLIAWTGAATFVLAPFGAYALNLAAIRFQAEHDWAEVRARCRALLREARVRLNALTGQPALCPDEVGWYAQMAAVRLPEGVDCAALKQRLYDEHRIEVPVYRFNGLPLLRVSVQGYNSESDLDRLVSALQGWL